MNKLRASIIVPAKNETEYINTFLDRLVKNITSEVEVLIVVDSIEDLTLSHIQSSNFEKLSLRKLVSTYGPGPANAIKYGIDSATTGIVVVTMADGSDDPRNVDDLILLIERGCSVAVASRYMPGGQQIGGPKFKKYLSKTASFILRIFAGIPTHDSTNSFKAYSMKFLKEAKIESRNGFEVGLELVAKAHRNKLLIAEVPTIWIDRLVGKSHFSIRKWLPYYLYWFLYAFGLRLKLKDIR
jgi:glycosyltransferase involved in cell wall biosynthesis